MVLLLLRKLIIPFITLILCSFVVSLPSCSVAIFFLDLNFEHVFLGEFEFSIWVIFGRAFGEFLSLFLDHAFSLIIFLLGLSRH